ncbi:hypothetical protein [Salinivibrio proteolyticus]|uniref:hypothetical protein n=1 Tax=Salinivibrio proteolyticus TaxID=334715 RepID=UPI000988CB11|nr:hypothetical protein [Salinivibrio proteolyticus]OOF30360.1 hypothetical protein BZJ20_10865 [Salinivibrio proteolyticus]
MVKYKKGIDVIFITVFLFFSNATLAMDEKVFNVVEYENTRSELSRALIEDHKAKINNNDTIDSGDNNVLIIHTNSGLVPDKTSQLTPFDTIILLGTPENNKSMMMKIFGIGMARSTIVITNAHDKAKREITSFRYDKTKTDNQKLARVLMKYVSDKID